MNVADVMRTQVFFLSPANTVREAARALIVNDVESALVRGGDGTIVGLVSEGICFKPSSPTYPS